MGAQVHQQLGEIGGHGVGVSQHAGTQPQHPPVTLLQTLSCSALLILNRSLSSWLRCLDNRICPLDDTLRPLSTASIFLVDGCGSKTLKMALYATNEKSSDLIPVIDPNFNQQHDSVIHKMVAQQINTNTLFF